MSKCPVMVQYVKCQKVGTMKVCEKKFNMRRFRHNEVNFEVAYELIQITQNHFNEHFERFW